MASIVGRTHKVCTLCGESKPNEQFHFTVSERGYRASRCKPCAREYERARNRELKRKNPEEYKRTRQRYMRKTRYGMAHSDYEELLLEQDGVCAICRRGDGTGQDLEVDHCHKTGLVRGLLCTSCNNALGMFRDDTRILLRARQYLARSHGKSTSGH